MPSAAGGEHVLQDLPQDRASFLTPTWPTAASSKSPPVWLTLGVLEVVPPQGTDLVLATHVPHGEADVLVLHRLHIEP